MRKNKGQTRKRAYVETDGNYIRSRTISGYDPSGDFADKQIELEHTKAQKKIRRKKRRRSLIMLLLVLFGLLVFAFSQMTVTIIGADYSDSTINRSQDEGYVGVATQYLVEHPSERFSWSRRNESLTAHVQKTYPEVAAAEIRGGFGVGRLYLEIRKPVAVWKTASSSSFVDKDGAVFEKNYYSDPEVIINDQSGSGVISQRFLQFVGKIIAGVDSSGIGKVEKVTIPAGSIRYVEITLAGRTYPIKIQTDRDAGSQIADVVNMIKYLDKKTITPSYVDVRVKNRGFWK